MPTPNGPKSCTTCGLPYQAGRKAVHDQKASHRSAVATRAAEKAAAQDQGGS